jgi:hypothetical protein
MWTKPREVVRQQLDTEPQKHVLLIAILAGAAGQVANNMVAMPPEPALRLGALAGIVAFGAVSGVIWLYVGGWLMGMAGRWIGGVASAMECRTAMAWSMIPTLWMAPVNLVIGLYYVTEGADAIAPPRDGGVPANVGFFEIMPPWMVAIMGIGMIVGLWQLVISCMAVGEAHQFSGWRGLGTLLLSGIALMGLMIGVAVLVGLVIAIIVAVASQV